MNSFFFFFFFNDTATTEIYTLSLHDALPIQLGCKKLIRVGTCGGLQPHHALGDLIVALTAVPADSTAMHLVGNEPHCPTASWGIVHEAVHIAKHGDLKLHVGPIVSSDL